MQLEFISDILRYIFYIFAPTTHLVKTYTFNQRLYSYHPYIKLQSYIANRNYAYHDAAFVYGTKLDTKVCFVQSDCHLLLHLLSDDVKPFSDISLTLCIWIYIKESQEQSSRFCRPKIVAIKVVSISFVNIEWLLGYHCVKF